MPPGTQMSHYCSFNIQFLGEIVRRISSRSLPDFCQDSLCRPLGMRDTFWTLPDGLRHRLVRRSEDAPWADIFAQYRVVETPWAAGGALSTALDMATFGQMFLNRGSYGDARVLRPAAVAAATRNQIPGISAHPPEGYLPEASWGMSWNVHGPKKILGSGEPLPSPQSFSHAGAGGAYLWVDPPYELVGAYFSVLSEGGIPSGIQVPERLRSAYASRRYLFVNATTAAVI